MGIPVIDFSFLKRMITQIDDDEIDLNPNASNKIEAELAKSREEIEGKVDKYNEHRKEKRKKILEETKVNEKQLNKKPNKDLDLNKVQDKQEKGREPGE